MYMGFWDLKVFDIFKSFAKPNYRVFSLLSCNTHYPAKPVINCGKIFIIVFRDKFNNLVTIFSWFLGAVGNHVQVMCHTCVHVTEVAIMRVGAYIKPPISIAYVASVCPHDLAQAKASVYHPTHSQLLSEISLGFKTLRVRHTPIIIAKSLALPERMGSSLHCICQCDHSVTLDVMGLISSAPRRDIGAIVK